MKTASRLARLSRRGGAAIIAAIALVFCLSSGAPAMAEPAACHGPDASPKMCAQAGAAGAIIDHLLGFTEHAVPTRWMPAQTGRVSPGSGERLVSRCHLVPSAPRAPPFSFN